MDYQNPRKFAKQKKRERHHRRIVNMRSNGASKHWYRMGVKERVRIAIKKKFDETLGKKTIRPGMKPVLPKAEKIGILNQSIAMLKSVFKSSR